MLRSHRSDDQGAGATAQDLLRRYGSAAPRVAREWATIKYQQGAPQTAAIWLRVANMAEHAAEAAAA